MTLGMSRGEGPNFGPGPRPVVRIREGTSCWYVEDRAWNIDMVVLRLSAVSRQTEERGEGRKEGRRKEKKERETKKDKNVLVVTYCRWYWLKEGHIGGKGA